MKKVRLTILFLLLAALLCACGRKTTDGETPDRPGSVFRPGSTAAKPSNAAPASGTDLAIPEPRSEAAREALDELRREMAEQSCVCAVTGLGGLPAGEPLAAWLESSGLLSDLAELTEKYAFLPELTPVHCVDTGFRMLYCAVPLDENAAVCIQAPGMDDYQGPAGEPVLFASDKASVSISLLHADGSRTEFSEKDPLAPQPGVLNFAVPLQ